MPTCQTSSLLKAEQKREKVESPNPSLPITCRTPANSDQTPTTGRSARPLRCQVGSWAREKKVRWGQTGTCSSFVRRRSGHPSAHSPGARSLAWGPRRELRRPGGRPGPLAGGTVHRPLPLVQASASLPLPPSRLPGRVPAFPAGDGRRRQRREERAGRRLPGPCTRGCSEPAGPERSR